MLLLLLEEEQLGLDLLEGAEDLGEGGAPDGILVPARLSGYGRSGWLRGGVE